MDPISHKARLVPNGSGGGKIELDDSFTGAPDLSRPCSPNGLREENGSHHGLKTGLERTLPYLESLGDLSSQVTELAVVIPATDNPPTLQRCLDALSRSTCPPAEVIVVDDPADGGRGAARNAGAARASSEVLVFIDSDVEVHPDALERIRDSFDSDPDLTALFGSYDDEPEAPGAVSAFCNLHHHYVHQESAGPATTFWTGLGAIRRTTFETVGGFDTSYALEDIELGMRLSAKGAHIRLDPEVRGKHLKLWTLREMLLAGFILRGAPWVELLLREGTAPRTLNLGWRHRLSAAACLLGLGALPFRSRRVATGAAVSLLALNHSFYGLLLVRRGPVEAGAGIGLHVLHNLMAAACVPAGVVLHLANRTAPAMTGGPATPARPPERTTARVA